MALMYLQALRVFEECKVWPNMIPVIVESRKYKFVKKGKDLNHELAGLFNYIVGPQQQTILAQWSKQITSEL